MAEKLVVELGGQLNSLKGELANIQSQIQALVMKRDRITALIEAQSAYLEVADDNKSPNSLKSNKIQKANAEKNELKVPPTSQGRKSPLGEACLVALAENDRSRKKLREITETIERLGGNPGSQNNVWVALRRLVSKQLVRKYKGYYSLRDGS